MEIDNAVVDTLSSTRVTPKSVSPFKAAAHSIEVARHSDFLEAAQIKKYDDYSYSNVS
jgi:hypothetical protein